MLTINLWLFCPFTHAPSGVFLPVPVVLAHGAEVALGGPALVLLGQAGGGVIRRHVPGATCGHVAGNALTAGGFKCTDYVEHTVASACAQVDLDALWRSQGRQRFDMALGQIHHVNVVANTGAIGVG